MNTFIKLQGQYRFTPIYTREKTRMYNILIQLLLFQVQTLQLVIPHNLYGTMKRNHSRGNYLFIT